MKDCIIFFLLIYHVVLRILTDHFDSDVLYYFSDSVFIGLVGWYVFSQSQKSVFSLMSFLGVAFVGVSQFINTLYLYIHRDEVLKGILSEERIEQINQLPMLLKAVFIGVIFLLIFRNRYTWRKQKSVTYNPNRVQAIYSKPKTVLTLLGATTSLSPKCSVRFSYNGETIRFKKGSETPLKQPTKLTSDEIIEETTYTPEHFSYSWQLIKDKKYNLFTFNCRKLLNAKS